MTRGNDLLRHGVIVLAGTLGANALGYVFHFAMSRLLGVSGYGSMLGLFSIIILVAIPALVAQTVVAKTVASYADEHRVDRIRRFVRIIVPSAVGIALVAAGCLCLARTPVLDFLNSSDSSGVFLVAWSVVFYLVLPILYGVLQGEQRFRGLAISLITDALVRASLAVLLVKNGADLNGALLAIAIGATCATALSALFVSDLMRAPDRDHVPLVGGPSLRASLHVSAGILMISTLASIDVLLVKHYRTSYEAGLFGSLALIGRIVYLVASFVPTIVLPKAAARISTGRSPVPLLLAAVAVFLIVLSIVLVPLLAFPALVLRTVAGAPYATAAPLLALYGSAIAFLAAAYAAANYNIGVNRLGFVWPVMVIGCAEIGLIMLRHESLLTIVRVLALGHFLIFLSTAFRIWVYRDATRSGTNASPARETLAS